MDEINIVIELKGELLEACQDIDDELIIADFINGLQFVKDEKFEVYVERHKQPKM